MNAKVAEKWIEALRSGKYKQTQQTLYAGNSFCCLGVLCDLAISEGVLGKMPGDPVTALLPRSVRDWSGISDGSCNDLAELNDQGPAGIGFPGIADYIEGHSEEL